MTHTCFYLQIYKIMFPEKKALKFYIINYKIKLVNGTFNEY